MNELEFYIILNLTKGKHAQANGALCAVQVYYFNICDAVISMATCTCSSPPSANCINNHVIPQLCGIIFPGTFRGKPSLSSL